MSHPEDVRSVYLSDCRGADYGRLDDALSASPRGLDVELLRPSEHDGVVLLGTEVALGHCYTALDRHADAWADEHEADEVRACGRLRDALYGGLSNARAAVGLARIQQDCRRGGDRTAVEETYEAYYYGTVDA